MVTAVRAGAWLAALALAVACASVACAVARARADDEPPPEAPQGADYVLEPADSVDRGSVDLDLAFSGRAGARPTSSRRVRFDDGSVAGTFREGAGDPLAGGALDVRLAGGRLGVGRLAPRWGQGLVLGAAGEPWTGARRDRGAGSGFRGRAGSGLAWRSAPGRSYALDVLAGRFARIPLAGARVSRADGVALGLVASAAGRFETSAALERAGGALELALDRRGGWRAEARRARPLGVATLTARVRAGTAGFRSLPEPARSGPAQAGSLTFERGGSVPVSAMAGVWRFRPGLGGARAALEVQRRLAHHASVAVGFEEQHGARRDPPPSSTGMRQGVWAQATTGSAGLRLTLRQELWGARNFARAQVRVLEVARVEAAGPFATSLGVEQDVWQAQHGENLYLAEDAVDRIVLRALVADGERTRVQLARPLAAGRLRATATWIVSGARAPRPQWRLDWTRGVHTAPHPGDARAP